MSVAGALVVVVRGGGHVRRAEAALRPHGLCFLYDRHTRERAETPWKITRTFAGNNDDDGGLQRHVGRYPAVCLL